MYQVGLANTRISTDYDAQQLPRSLHGISNFSKLTKRQDNSVSDHNQLYNHYVVAETMMILTQGAWELHTRKFFAKCKMRSTLLL
jgi:hypothetical protein